MGILSIICSCTSSKGNSKSRESEHQKPMRNGDAPPRSATKPHDDDQYSEHSEHEEKTAQAMNESGAAPPYEEEDKSYPRPASKRPSEPVNKLAREPEEHFGQQHLITDESIDRQASPQRILTRELDGTEEDGWFEAKDHTA